MSYTRKRIIIISFCLLISILLLSGCQSNNDKSSGSNPTPEPPKPWVPVASLEDITYDADTPDNIIIEGRRAYQSSCSACHDLPTTQRIKEFGSNEELIEYTIPMTEAAGIPVEHSEKIIRYMLGVLNDNVP